jgi:hypothetical protein
MRKVAAGLCALLSLPALTPAQYSVSLLPTIH